MTALLEIKNIETYYDLIYAIRGTSLTVDEGTITAILGTNGAGKSTILKTVMGLIDDQPDKGTIEFKGRRVDRMDTEKIVRLGISYVPEGREIFEELSVKENLLMGAYTRRDRHNVAKDFDRIYGTFPVLKERHNQWAGTLSGGEQQMLAIGLVKEIFEIIKTINTEGVTILLVEQNARMALSIADVGLIIENGRFVMKGNAKELMEDKDVKEFYMGVRSEASVKGYQRWKRKKAWR
jgi:branched-chain amino acid transport system ATP-binding protein